MHKAMRRRLQDLQAKWLAALEADDANRSAYEIDGRRIEWDTWRLTLVQCIREAEEALAVQSDSPMLDL